MASNLARAISGTTVFGAAVSRYLPACFAASRSIRLEPQLRLISSGNGKNSTSTTASNLNNEHKAKPSIQANAKLSTSNGAKNGKSSLTPLPKAPPSGIVTPALANISADPDAEHVPYRETPKECRWVPPSKAVRSDDVEPPRRNHEAPYHRYFCDPIEPPFMTPRFKRHKCCLDHGPRRPRKPAQAAAKCATTSDAKCDPGTPGKDTCRKLTCPGCAPVREPTTCFEIRPPDLCVRIEPPTVCFHDCVRDPIPDLPPSECTCHADKLPPCEPTPRRVRLADR